MGCCGTGSNCCPFSFDLVLIFPLTNVSLDLPSGHIMQEGLKTDLSHIFFTVNCHARFTRGRLRVKTTKYFIGSAFRLDSVFGA